MKFRTTAIAMASGLLLAATQASAVVIDFENLAVGTTLAGQYTAQGATFSANAFSGASGSSSGKPWSAKTDMTIVSSTGTDVGGLGTPSLVSGNILHSFNGWLGETDGDPSFKITFSGAGVSAVSMTFAGVGSDAPADVRLFVYNGSTLLTTVTGPSSGQFVLSATAPKITSVAVAPGSFSDWVGVDNITYTLLPVPEVSTYLMMALGLGALALQRRRVG